MPVTAILPSHDNPELESDDLYDVAKELFDRAAAARGKGDAEASRRLLKAALGVMSEEPTEAHPSKTRSASPETTKVVELLKEGWQEVAYLCEQTGLSVNRVHSIIARLRRQQGINLHAQAIKRYRITDK